MQMTQDFKIQQIFLKDLSFQAPMGATIFMQDWSPSVKVDMSVGHSGLADDLTEVALTLSVVTSSQGSTAFMIEVVQAGVFKLSGFEGEEREHILLGKCPAILFPYAREVIDATLMKGRFPALILDPVDFEAKWSAQTRAGLRL
jgi:preprotein translocase subunit SecB